MKKSDDLEVKLKQTDPEIQQFVNALQTEISNLQKNNIKLEAKNMSLKARINALKNEISQYVKHKPLELMSLEEIDEMIENLEKILDE
jgi:cell division protein FtsB